MAAKGAESKTKLFAKLMEIYPDAFFEEEGKILRVPMDESGTRVEIKVTLTAAKTNLGGDHAASAFPEESPVQSDFMPAPASNVSTEVTQEEKDNISKLMQALNF